MGSLAGQGRPPLCPACSAAAKMLSCPRISQHPARAPAARAGWVPPTASLKATLRKERTVHTQGDPTSRGAHQASTACVEACPQPVRGAVCPLHWRATSSRSGKASTTRTRVGRADGRACAGPTRLPGRYVHSTALKGGRGPALVGNVEAARPALSPTASPRLQARGARGLPAALGVLGRARHASESFQLHHCSHTAHAHTRRRV